MIKLSDDRSRFALVDDELDSARLLLRNLAVFGIEDCEWLGDVGKASRQLEQRLSRPQADMPQTLIVDLKEDLAAAEAFVARFSPELHLHGGLIVAITGSQRPVAGLLNAGADAVFGRHDDLFAYGRVVQRIASLRVQRHLPKTGT